MMGRRDTLQWLFASADNDFGPGVGVIKWYNFFSIESFTYKSVYIIWFLLPVISFLVLSSPDVQYLFIHLRKCICIEKTIGICASIS